MLIYVKSQHPVQLHSFLSLLYQLLEAHRRFGSSFYSSPHVIGCR